MPISSQIRRPITEEIEEIKSKLSLLKGDKKSYYESSAQALEDCKKRVSDLRRENSRWRQQLQDRMIADDHVIGQAFQNKPDDRTMLANKTASKALITMDTKVSDRNKKLNSLRYVSEMKRKHLSELITRYEELFADSANAQATLEGLNKDGQELRDLENRLDKGKMKCSEAGYINKTYEKIKERLQEEYLVYGNKLDAMEKEILRCREELHGLKIMKEDAVLARDSAQEELKKQEDLVFSERRRRDIELANMRGVAYEKRMQQEKVEKRMAARDSVSHVEDAEEMYVSITDERRRRLAEFEERFKLIKEVTGNANLEEVIERFTDQGSINTHLQDMIKEHEKSMSKLTDKKMKFTETYESLKFNHANTQTEGDRLICDFKYEIQEKDLRREVIINDLRRANKTLMLCKAGIEHIYDKMRHINVQYDNLSRSQSELYMDDFVLDILSEAEGRIYQLMNDFDQLNIDEMIDTMHREDCSEFITLPDILSDVEFNVPHFNTRITIPVTKKDNIYEGEDEDDSGDDDADVLTRKDIKIQSQHIVDSKSKNRRNPKKKKKTKGK